MARRKPPPAKATPARPPEPRRETFTPWQDLFAFLLLVSASLVVVFLLLATRHYYPSFAPRGQFLAWVVVIGCFMALGSLMVILLRLYIRPVIVNGRARKRRKRNP